LAPGDLALQQLGRCLDPPFDPCCSCTQSNKKECSAYVALQGIWKRAHKEDADMRLLLSAISCLILSMASPAVAQDAVADRAVAAAKEYVKAKGLKDPKLTILLSSLYNNSFPDFAKKWEELTGVKFEIVPLGYTDIPAKIMQESVSKTGVYDIFNDFPYTMPDAAGAKVIIALDDLAKKYQPDFSGIADGLKFQQYYDGKLYAMINDGDHLLFVLRKDLMENPQARAEYKAKTGKELGCPETVAEWAQQAAFFQTKEGDTRWGIKFEKGLSGGLGYRSVNFSYRHFPLYMKGLLFDKDMNPRITTPDGIQAIKDFAAAVEYMPKDIQGWGTPQIYPYWGSGLAYSAVSFPSIYGFGESNPSSVVKGKQLACLIPGNMVDGKLVRRSPQAAGTAPARPSGPRWTSANDPSLRVTPSLVVMTGRLDAPL
jgi:ABC-type glycerol-3-phosphate transport system substrate-binding protein